MSGNQQRAAFFVDPLQKKDAMREKPTVLGAIAGKKFLVKRKVDPTRSTTSFMQHQDQGQGYSSNRSNGSAGGSGDWNWGGQDLDGNSFSSHGTSQSHISPRKTIVAHKIQPRQTIQLAESGASVTMPSIDKVSALPQRLVVDQQWSGPRRDHEGNIQPWEILGSPEEFEAQENIIQTARNMGDKISYKEQLEQLYRQQQSQLQYEQHLQQQRMESEEQSTSAVAKPAAFAPPAAPEAGYDRQMARNLEKKLAMQAFGHMSLQQQMDEQRQEKKLRRWEFHKRQWEAIKQRIGYKIGRVPHQLVISSSDEFRPKMEGVQMIETGKTLTERAGTEIWRMSLRDNNASHVGIGNIFSGLFCEIRQRFDPTIEFVKKPSSAYSTPDSRQKEYRVSNWAQSKLLVKAAKKLKKFVPKFRSVNMEADPDQLVIVGTDLFEDADAGMPEDMHLLSDVHLEVENKDEDAASLARAADPVTNYPFATPLSVQDGPRVEVSASRLYMQCHEPTPSLLAGASNANVGAVTSACASVTMRNCGTTVLYYKWSTFNPMVAPAVKLLASGNANASSNARYDSLTDTTVSAPISVRLPEESNFSSSLTSTLSTLSSNSENTTLPSPVISLSDAVTDGPSATGFSSFEAPTNSDVPLCSVLNDVAKTAFPVSVHSITAPTLPQPTLNVVSGEAYAATAFWCACPDGTLLPGQMVETVFTFAPGRSGMYNEQLYLLTTPNATVVEEGEIVRDNVPTLLLSGMCLPYDRASVARIQLQNYLKKQMAESHSLHVLKKTVFTVRELFPARADWRKLFLRNNKDLHLYFYPNEFDKCLELATEIVKRHKRYNRMVMRWNESGFRMSQLRQWIEEIPSHNAEHKKPLLDRWEDLRALVAVRPEPTPSLYKIMRHMFTRVTHQMHRQSQGYRSNLQITEMLEEDKLLQAAEEARKAEEEERKARRGKGKKEASSANSTQSLGGVSAGEMAVMPDEQRERFNREREDRNKLEAEYNYLLHKTIKMQLLELARNFEMAAGPAWDDPPKSGRGVFEKFVVAHDAQIATPDKGCNFGNGKSSVEFGKPRETKEERKARSDAERKAKQQGGFRKQQWEAEEKKRQEEFDAMSPLVTKGVLTVHGGPTHVLAQAIDRRVYTWATNITDGPLSKAGGVAAGGKGAAAKGAKAPPAKAAAPAANAAAAPVGSEENVEVTEAGKIKEIPELQGLYIKDVHTTYDYSWIVTDKGEVFRWPPLPKGDAADAQGAAPMAAPGAAAKKGDKSGSLPPQAAANAVAAAPPTATAEATAEQKAVADAAAAAAIPEPLLEIQDGFQGLEVNTIVSGLDPFQPFHIALTAQGQLYSWGETGKFNTLGFNDKANRDRPELLDLFKGMNVVHVAVGLQHVVVLLDNGALYSWGNNEQGALGLGDKRSRVFPSLVGSLCSVADLPKELGEGNGQTGDPAAAGGAPAASAVPAAGAKKGSAAANIVDDSASKVEEKLLAPNDKVIFVGCGLNHTMCLTQLGYVFTWGEGANGVLGHGDDRSQDKPTLVEGFFKPVVDVPSPAPAAPATAAAAAAGGSSRPGTTSKAGAGAKPASRGSQILAAATPEPSRSRIRVESPPLDRATSMKQLAVGAQHALALATNGDVWVWGSNAQGQLGIETDENSPDVMAPVKNKKFGPSSVPPKDPAQAEKAKKGGKKKEDAPKIEEVVVKCIKASTIHSFVMIPKELDEED